MKKTALLAGVIAPLLAGMGVATSSFAQPSATNDEVYCQALVKAYAHGGIERGFAPESLDTTVAISQCRDGNPRPAIPVLEEKLRDNDFALPPRN